MKQFVILFLLFTISPISFTFAQNKIFCEIIEQIVSQKKTRIYLDYGQERNKKKDIRLENENEKAEIFYSRVEALNIMSALGWKFEQAYVKVSGSSGNGYGSTSSTTHYLLSKDVDSIQEINNIIDEIKAKKSELNNIPTESEQRDTNSINKIFQDKISETLNYLIDTHSHIYAEEFDADRDEAIRRAREAGVERLLLPAIDSESHGRLFDTVRRYPDHCTPMMGLHPTSINDNPRWREELALVERYLCSPPEGVGRFCAVGEIGLDYYWDDRFKAEQLEAFTKQCRLAAPYDLPVAIHTRAAWKDMCRTVETETKAAREKGLRLRGVFHAFAEDADTYRQLKECGDFLFGIGGVVTFKKSRLADTVREMELDDLVLETDCPYLTPVPYRGQRNESGYIPYICNKIAALKGTTPEEVAAATTRNARRMFGFDAARQTTNDHSSPTESI